MSLAALALALTLGAPARLVIGLRVPDARVAAAEAQLRSLVTLARGHEVRRLPYAIVVDVADGATARATLAHRLEVRWIEDEVRLRVRLRAAPNDPLWPLAWHLHATGSAAGETAIGVEAAWLATRGRTAAGSAVRVAVVDDGFDLAHPDLTGRFLAGRNFSAGVADDVVAAGATDTHGTQTAGVIAADTDNALGVAGVCPDCELLPVRLLGGGGPAGLFEIDSTVAAEAIVWAYENGADVINNSWGPADGSPLDPNDAPQVQALPRALDEALTRAATLGRGGLGTVITWASGNGNEPVAYDRFASHPAVVAVGAVDANGARAYYSDFGPPLALVAPSSGEDGMPSIWTCDLTGALGDSTDDYSGRFGGTSAGSAMVAGVAALVLARYPALTAAQVIEALERGAYPIDAARGAYDDAGRSPYYGFGRVDAAGALAAAAVYSDGCTQSLELCGNGRDDNCDGRSDEPERCTACIPDGPREICDGHDNDCDGEVDEGFVCQATDRPICAPCTSSSECLADARCRSAPGLGGSWCFSVCASGESCAADFACDGEVCALDAQGGLTCEEVLGCAPEGCNGVDDDCNGLVDDVDRDGLEASRARAEVCGQQTGVCADAEAVCDAGVWRCESPATFEAREASCDGLDNDCNGEVDEPAACDGCSAAPGMPVSAVVALALARLARLARGRRLGDFWG